MLETHHGGKVGPSYRILIDPIQDLRSDSHNHIRCSIPGGQKMVVVLTLVLVTGVAMEANGSLSTLPTSLKETQITIVRQPLLLQQRQEHQQQQDPPGRLQQGQQHHQRNTPSICNHMLVYDGTPPPGKDLAPATVLA